MRVVPVEDVVEASTPPAKKANRAAAAVKSADEARETEVKFTTDSDGLAAALASPLLGADGAGANGRKLTSVYYDTPDWDLQRNRMALRLRRSGRGAPVMTLKWPAESSESVFARGEFEVHAPKSQPDLSLVEGEIGEHLRRIVGDKKLEAKYETRFWRVARLIKYGEAEIEAAFDEGVLRAGERSRALCEVELELKSGSPFELYELAASLAESLPLTLDMVSKAERACYFATETAPAPVKAKAPALSDEVPLDEAITRIILGACRHYLVNWAPLRDGDHPEAIHQMRVALRRLRAVLAMFKRVIPCAEFESFRAEAKSLATAMGSARDCDALREMIETGPLGHFGERKDFSPLLDALEARRLDAYSQARALLAAPAPTLFALRLNAFVAQRGWRNALSGEELAILTEPAADFAAEALQRLYKRVLRRGKNLAALPDDARHQARIALKNLRYGSEFFASCFRDNRSAAFIRAIANLQNLLGAHNDAAAADQFLRQAHEAEAARAAGLVTGWFARGAVIADENLTKAWKVFRRIEPFWR